MRRLDLRTCWALLVLLCPLGPALASPLGPGGDHAFEQHASEDHRDEMLDAIILSDADLSGTRLDGSSFRDALLDGADLSDAGLKHTDFSGADLSEAILTGAQASGADFVGAILDGADLREVDVKHADFRNASLLGADLSSLRNALKADFTGAWYDGATLLHPDIDAARMLYYVPEPGENALLLAGLGCLAAVGRRRSRTLEAA